MPTTPAGQSETRRDNDKAHTGNGVGYIYGAVFSKAAARVSVSGRDGKS